MFTYILHQDHNQMLLSLSNDMHQGSQVGAHMHYHQPNTGGNHAEQSINKFCMKSNPSTSVLYVCCSAPLIPSPLPRWIHCHEYAASSSMVSSQLSSSMVSCCEPLTPSPYPRWEFHRPPQPQTHQLIQSDAFHKLQCADSGMLPTVHTLLHSMLLCSTHSIT
jgi:hypothetical protein